MAAGDVSSCDCLIVGGGPAGCALAASLRASGLAIVLVDDPRRRHAIPEETLLPAAAARIEQAGFAPVFAAHRFFGAARQGVLWNDARVAWRDLDAAQRGFQVERGAFDRALREHVRALGVVVLDAHRVAVRLPDSGAGRVRVDALDGTAVEVDARAFALAAGRGRHRALLDADVAMHGADTTSFVVGGAQDEETGTLIEAVAEGWLWSIPRRDGARCVGVFVATEEVREAGAATLVRRAFANARAVRADECTTPAHGANATARLLRARTPVVLCGDAAATIDPLSSQGIEKALASADHAACAIRTALAEPALRDDAFAAHFAWERRLWRSHLRDATQQYLREERFADRAFWRARRRLDLLRAPLAADALVRAHPQLVPRRALRRAGDRFVAEPGFAPPDAPTALASIGPVPLAPLLALLAQPCTLGALLASAARDATLFPLPPRAVVAAVELLVDEGFALAERA